MKKSLLLILSLPLLLASCDLSTGSGSSKQTSETTTDTTNQTEEKTDIGTEGSGTGTTTGGEEHSGHEHHTGGGTGEGTTGGGTTGGGETTGGGTTGGQTETKTTTVSKDVIDFNLSNAQKPSELSINSDIKLTLSVGSNTAKNAPAYYESDCSLRFYPGNTLTITSTKGSITNIEFNYDGTGFSSSTGSLSDKTWTGSSSNVTFTEAGSKGNTKVFALSITYGGTGGGSTTGGGTTGGETTGGGTETGGGTTTGGGGQTGTKDYTSTWPSEYQKYVTTYVNGMVPCYLNVNKKCLFNKLETSSIDNGSVPVLVAKVVNTSPDINYVYDYGVILKDAGFKLDEQAKDDDGDTWYYYVKGLCTVMYCKYRGSDNVYYFDARMYYEEYNDQVAPNSYVLQYDDKDLGLTNRYESNNKTVSINGWSITLNDIMKSSYSMQLKKDSGKITIKGSIKSVYVEVIQNGDALFMKAGTSASNAKYVFNNGGLFEFPSGTTYVEITAESRVLQFEFLELAK